MWGRIAELKKNATAGLGALRGAAQQLGRELVADVEEEERTDRDTQRATAAFAAASATTPNGGAHGNELQGDEPDGTDGGPPPLAAHSDGSNALLSPTPAAAGGVTTLDRTPPTPPFAGAPSFAAADGLPTPIIPSHTTPTQSPAPAVAGMPTTPTKALPSSSSFHHQTGSPNPRRTATPAGATAVNHADDHNGGALNLVDSVIVNLRSQLTAAEEQNVHITREYKKLFMEKDKELNEYKQRAALVDSLPKANGDGNALVAAELASTQALLDDVKRDNERLKNEQEHLRSAAVSREDEIASYHDTQMKKLRATHDEQLAALRSGNGSSSAAIAAERADWDAKLARITAQSAEHEKRATRLATQSRELAEAITRERTLITDNASLKDNIDRLRQEHTQQSSSSSSSLARITAECADLERKLKAQADTMQQHDAAMASRTTQLRNLATQLDESKASYRALNDRLEAERVAAATAAAKNEEKFTAALMTRTTSTTAATGGGDGIDDAALHLLGDKGVDTHEQINAAVREMERLSARCVEKTAQVTSLRDAQALADERQKESRVTTDRTIAQLRQQLADLERQQSSDRVAADARATDLIAQRTRDIAAINVNLSDATVARDKLQLRLDELVRDHQLELKSQADTATERFEKLRSDKERLVIECTRLTDLDRKRSRLDDERQAERDRDMDAQRADAERVVSTMRDELNAARSLASEQVASEKRAMAQVAALTNDLIAAKEQVATLKSQLDHTAAAAGDEAQATISALQSQISKQNEQIATMNRSLAELERVRAALSAVTDDNTVIRSLISAFLTSHSLPIQIPGATEPVAPSALVRHAISLVQRRLEDVGRLQTEYKKATDTIASFQAKQGTQDTQKEAQLRQMTSRYETMVQSYQKMQSECRDALRREDELKSQLEKLIRDRDELSSTLTVVKSTHESTSSIGATRVEELTAECNKLRGEMAAYTGSIAKLQADIEGRIREKVAREADHERDMKAANHRLREMSAEVERLKKHLQEAANGSQESYDERQREIDQLHERLSQAHLDAQANEALVADYHDLQRRYTAKERECDTAATAQSNLESVLQQFQAEQNTRWRAAEAELREARDVAANARRTMADAKSLHDRVEAAESLVKEKQVALAAAQDWARKLDVERRTLRSGFEATMERLKKFSSDDHAIDRRLVVKLLVTFFERNEKDDVLELMMRMLQFTSEEKTRVLQHRKASGIGGRIKSLASFLPMLSPFDSGEKMYQPTDGDQNLGDLWIDFLLKEAGAPAGAPGASTLDMSKRPAGLTPPPTPPESPSHRRIPSHPSSSSVAPSVAGASIASTPSSATVTSSGSSVFAYPASPYRAATSAPLATSSTPLPSAGAASSSPYSFAHLHGTPSTASPSLYSAAPVSSTPAVASMSVPSTTSYAPVPPSRPIAPISSAAPATYASYTPAATTGTPAAPASYAYPSAAAVTASPARATYPSAATTTTTAYPTYPAVATGVAIAPLSSSFAAATTMPPSASPPPPSSAPNGISQYAPVRAMGASPSPPPPPSTSSYPSYAPSSSR